MKFIKMILKINFNKRILLMSLSLLIAISSCSQKTSKDKKKAKVKPGHKIEFNINGLSNEKLIIAYNYDGKHYISDTILLDQQGKGYLAGEESKEKGVYLAVFPSLGNNYFEFLVSDQYFSIFSDTANLQKNLRFENSEDNEIFITDMLAMSELRKKTSQMKKDAAGKGNEETKKVDEEINKLNGEFIAHRDELCEKYPDYFYTDLLQLMKVVEIPDPEKKANGELVDSSFGWKYWKKHYWDYTDFSEEGILRTPVFHTKLIEFMEKRTSPIQDSLIVSAHKVIELSKQNDEVFKYTLATLVNKYANSRIMGDDAVYVYLVQSYYATGQAYWTDSAQLAKMLERANALAPLALGKISPDLYLRDTTLEVKYRLHDLPSQYTVVFVWDPDCGHCKKAAPVVRDFYNKYKNKDILVYSIATIGHTELDLWKDFIKEKNLNFINVADPYVETNFRNIYDIASTPQIFVLDKDKKIIAKRIGAKQLEHFFFTYFKRNDKERFKGMEGLTFEDLDSTETH